MTQSLNRTRCTLASVIIPNTSRYFRDCGVQGIEKRLGSKNVERYGLFLVSMYVSTKSDSVAMATSFPP